MKWRVLLTLVMFLFVVHSAQSQTDSQNQASASEQQTDSTLTSQTVGPSAQSDNSAAAAGDDEVFIDINQMPEFPGGLSGIKKFLSNTVRYPQIAKENGIEGRVICSFVVERDGSITNVEVMRSSGDMSLDREAMRVIRAMPKWKPGIQNGQPVRVKYTMPVNFNL